MFRDTVARVSGARPTWEMLMGLMLRPGGSAAGVDGKPYELYQISPAGPSCLVAQAVLVGEHGSWAVRHVIGDEPDLLALVPKSPG